MVDFEIERIRHVLPEHFHVPPEINAIILKYLRWIYEGRYTRKDLETIPRDITCVFMLKIKVYDSVSIKDRVKLYCEGEVDVCVTEWFTFKFILDGTYYDLINGWICYDYDTTMMFEIDGGLHKVILLPHKFEL